MQVGCAWNKIHVNVYNEYCVLAQVAVRSVHVAANNHPLPWSLTLLSMVDFYFPEDARARFFHNTGIAPVAGLPLLDDEQSVPLRPQGGTRAMRDAYNEHTPMHLIADNVWVGCARHAAWKNNVLMENGIAHVLCTAVSSERRINHRDRGRKAVSLPLFDVNAALESPPDYKMHSLLFYIYIYNP